MEGVGYDMTWPPVSLKTFLCFVFTVFFIKCFPRVVLHSRIICMLCT